MMARMVLRLSVIVSGSRHSIRLQSACDPLGRPRAFGLPVPRIAVGAPADLALWDLDERWTVGVGHLRSKSRNCAFLGRTVQGRCLLTVARGAVAHRALPVAA